MGPNTQDKLVVIKDTSIHKKKYQKMVDLMSFDVLFSAKAWFLTIPKSFLSKIEPRNASRPQF